MINNSRKFITGKPQNNLFFSKDGTQPLKVQSFKISKCWLTIDFIGKSRWRNQRNEFCIRNFWNFLYNLHIEIFIYLSRQISYWPDWFIKNKILSWVFSRHFYNVLDEKDSLVFMQIVSPYSIISSQFRNFPNLVFLMKI